MKKHTGFPTPHAAYEFVESRDLKTLFENNTLGMIEQNGKYYFYRQHDQTFLTQKQLETLTVPKPKKEYPVGDKILPLEASAGDNAYYVGCEERGCRQNYGVCLHFMKALEEGRLPETSFQDCRQAYLREQCPAKKLREEEKAEGRALYFVKRKDPHEVIAELHKESGTPSPLKSASPDVDRESDSYKRIVARMEKTRKGTTPAKKAPAKPKPKNELADLVSDLAKEHIAKPADEPKRITPLPGESPLDFARRRKRLLSESA